MLTRKTKVKAIEIIPLDENAFCYKKDGVTVRGTGVMARGSAPAKAKSRSVRRLSEAIKSEQKLCNDKQIVLSIRTLSTHHSVRHYFRSAGLIDEKDYIELKKMSTQMKNVLEDLNSTEKSRGRASDEKRAARNSIVMSIVDTPENETEEEEEPKPRPKGRALKLIGLPRTTGARIWNSVAEKRYLIRTVQALNDFRMITKRHDFYSKVPPAGRLAIQKWVRNYHLVVHSPNNKDALKVKVVDEVNGGFKTVLKKKSYSHVL